MHLRGLSTTSARRRAWVTALTAGVLTAGLVSGPPAGALPAPDPPTTKLAVKSPPGGADVRVLVFHGSAAAGDESPVVNAGIEAIERIGLSGPQNQRFQVEATDDASVFTDATELGRYNAVVFLTGGGDVLDPERPPAPRASAGPVTRRATARSSTAARPPSPSGSRWAAVRSRSTPTAR